MLVSFSLVLVAVALFKQTVTSRMASLSATSGVFVALLLLATYYILDEMTGAGIDEAVLFHLTAGVAGAGFGEFADLMVVFGIMVFAAILTSLFCFRHFLTQTPTRITRLRSFLATATLLVSVYMNPGTADVVQILAQQREGAPVADIRAPDRIALADRVGFAGDRKNLVFLYLESLEQTYFDETLFPGLLPRLSALRDQALRFEDIGQTYGTSWTIAGMVASQCGIPLIASSGAGADQFLPNATCLGDLLGPAGYHLTYMGGASLAFAGKGTFYRSHGFDVVEGRDELLPLVADPDYTHYWGLYDDTLLELAKQRYDSLSGKDQTFGLVTLTVDSHDRTGAHIARSCDGLAYQDGSDRFLNSMHCSDMLAADFIEHILQSDGFEDTLLVVMSDHLARPNLAEDRLQLGNRRNMFWVFGQDIAPRVVTTSGNTLDAAPTILGLLGADVAALGYGRDLLKQAPLFASDAVDPEQVFQEDRAYLNALWSYPSLDKGLAVDVGANRLILGDRYVDLPALLYVDDAQRISRFAFDIPGEDNLSLRASSLGYADRFVWVDMCSEVALLMPSSATPQAGHCALIGSLGSTRTEVFPLADNELLSPARIAAVFDEEALSQSHFDGRIADIRRAVQFADATVIEYLPSNGMTGHYAVRSAGFPTTNTWVLDRADDSKLTMERGLTLVGFSQGGQAVKIGHRDTCGYGQEVLDPEAPRLENIAATIAENEGLYGAFAVIAHSSVVCFEVDPGLDDLFAGSDFVEWQSLWYNQPYVAVRAGNGDIEEFVGDPRTALGLDLRDFVETIRQRQQLWLPRIAHAGGPLDGQPATNSLPALDANADLFEIIEVDLSWTADDALVCLHDWSKDSIAGDGTPLTLAQFAARNGSVTDYRHCTLETLAAWLREKEGPRILLDVKGRAVVAAERIADLYPDVQDRFIPQMYHPHQYRQIRALGYDDIVWTLYEYGGDDEEVLAALTQMDLLGLSMYAERAATGLPARAKAQTGVLSWVHTVNSAEEYRAVMADGVAEIMTDYWPAPDVARYQVVSAGFGAGRTVVQNLQTKRRIALERGVSLVGLPAGGEPQVLARYDGCAILDTGTAPDHTAFRTALDTALAQRDPVVVVVHDSAFCTTVDIAPLFSGTPLTQWDGLAFRSPYIGFVPADGWVLEYRGETESAVAQVVGVIDGL